MLYTVYQTINKITNEKYIGVHKTKNADDNYLGSGTVLRKSIKKYGALNFEKKIIQIFDNPEDMLALEAELVNEETLDDLMNVIPGGKFNINYFKDGLNIWNGHAEYWKTIQHRGLEVHNELIATDPEYKAQWIKKLSEANKGQQAWLGKKHKEETKKKIGEYTKIHQKGSGNSQFGTCWITNGKENKKIKKDELDKFLNEGWRRGRITK